MSTKTKIIIELECDDGVLASRVNPFGECLYLGVNAEASQQVVAVSQTQTINSELRREDSLKLSKKQEKICLHPRGEPRGFSQQKDKIILTCIDTLIHASQDSQSQVFLRWVYSTLGRSHFHDK